MSWNDLYFAHNPKKVLMLKWILIKIWHLILLVFISAFSKEENLEVVEAKLSIFQIVIILKLDNFSHIYEGQWRCA